jgi:hypothetical protein
MKKQYKCKRFLKLFPILKRDLKTRTHSKEEYCNAVLRLLADAWIITSSEITRRKAKV